MSQKPSISIIIPVFNGEETIGICLQSVFRSDYHNFDVIVVDDGSTDGTLNHVIDFNCQTIRMDKNQGPAEARNQGAQKAKGGILFFLDMDITIEPDTLTRIVQTFKERTDISALFGSYQKETPVDNFISKYKNLLHHYTHQISREEAATFCGGFGAIHRDVFFAFGGFDPKYRYLEDIELGYRMHQAGHRILLKKDIMMTHHKRYSYWRLIKSDVLGRAKPWTKIMLDKRIFRLDLNTRIENLLSVPTAYGILLCLPITFFRPYGCWALFSLTLFFLIINHRFFIFILHERGIGFLLKSILLNWFGYLYSGIGLIMGMTSVFKRVRTKELQGGPKCF